MSIHFSTGRCFGILNFCCGKPVKFVSIELKHHHIFSVCSACFEWYNTRYLTGKYKNKAYREISEVECKLLKILK